MIDWFRDEGEKSLHDRSIERDIRSAELNPLVDIPFADHTDLRPDPPQINDRVPDEIRFNEFTREVTVVEKETRPNSGRSRNQNRDLSEGAMDLGFDFEVDVVDDLDRLF